jgi:tropomyosin, fungi type
VFAFLVVTPFLVKQKLAALRAEADISIERAEAAEAKNKTYEQELLQKDQEITSLTHRLSVLDAELEKAESRVVEFKTALSDGEGQKSTNELLTRKIQLLEEELDAAEKNVKETVEKCVPFHQSCLSSSSPILADFDR